MRTPRDKISISEVLATDSNAWNKIVEFHDISPGEAFFYKDAPNKEYIAEKLQDDEEDPNYGHDNGKPIDYDRKIMPLFSVTAMLDLISYCCPVQVIYNQDRSTVILDGIHVLQSEENEDLVALMWRATIKAHLEY